MSSQTITLMPRDEYHALVCRYADSFKDQDHKTIAGRYNACLTAVSRAGADRMEVLRRSAEARTLAAHLQAIEEALPHGM